MEVLTNHMSPEEVKRMEAVVKAARENINVTRQKLEKLLFEYEQHMIVNRYEEAEVIMGKIASFSVACHGWEEIKDVLEDFETPYEAIIVGVSNFFDRIQGGQDAN